MNIILIIIAALLAVSLAVLYNFLVIRYYPANRRKGAYVKTVVVFLLTITAVVAVQQVYFMTRNITNNVSLELEENIKQNNPGNVFVTQGFDLGKVANDSSAAGAFVAELRKILPDSGDLNISPLLYNTVVDSAMQGLQKNISIDEKNVKKAGAYMDANNVITVGSLIQGIKNNIMSVVKVIAIIFAAIFTVLFLTYVLTTLKYALAQKKTAS
jgi:predicted PurR-regulated permease PerM